MTLREKRVLFTKLKTELLTWIITELRVEVAEDEGRVLSPRTVRLKGGQKVQAEDGVHKKNSFHHSGLACDLLLYSDLDGDGDADYVVDGNHRLWKQIAEKWESLHPLCSSGARWEDANHISFGESEKKEPLPWLT